MISIRCDLRTHTFFTAGGQSSLQENIDAGIEAGLELLAVTDPFSSLVVDRDPEHPETEEDSSSEGDNSETSSLEDDEQEILPRDVSGVKLLYGCVADIVSPEGYLFGIGLPGEKKFWGDTVFMPDFIIALASGKWKPMEMSFAKATQMYISAVSDEKVLMLGNLCRSDLEFDYTELIRVCKSLNKPVEIDEQTLLLGDEVREKARKLLIKCAEEDVMICADSGALNAKEVGRLPLLQAELKEIAFPDNLIMNSDIRIFLDNYHKAGFRV
jgi:putative hydrolase